MTLKSLCKYLLDMPAMIKNKVLFAVHNVPYPENSRIKGKINIVNRGIIQIGHHCIINGKDKYDPIGCGNGCNLIVEGNGSITIGDFFGMSNSTIFSRESIVIGNHVLLGGGVKIYDTDFHSLDSKWRGTPEDRNHAVNRTVIIEDHVFVGAGSFILKGVHIGAGSIVGAGSVVTKNIPSGEIWAGNPAKFIRKVEEGYY